MNRFDLQKLGAVCAIIYGVLVVGTTVPLVALGTANPGSAAEFLPKLADNTTLGATTAILFIVMPLLLAIAGLGLFRLVYRGDSWAWLALFGFVGGGMSILYRGFTWMAMTLELAPAYVTAGAAEKTSLGAFGDTLHIFAMGADMVGAVLIGGMGVLVFALLMRKYEIGPRWMAWLGIFASVVGGFLTLVTRISDAIASISMIGDLAFFVWMIAVGVIAWRTPALHPDQLVRESPQHALS